MMEEDEEDYGALIYRESQLRKAECCCCGGCERYQEKEEEGS
jgi:hypothetical protein